MLVSSPVVLGPGVKCVFSHDSPFYLPHRGGCVCYSGDFICSKEDYTKAFKKDETPVGNITNENCLMAIAMGHCPALKHLNI